MYSQTDLTVGLINRTSNSSDVLTLVSGTGSNRAYLINSCGQYVHEWQDLLGGGFSSYLSDNGELVRCERGSTSFNAGGTAGRIAKYDWDSNLIWSADIAQQDSFQQHHDIALMPNGNVLALVWELMDYDTSIALGRDKDITSMQGVYMESIYEIKPIGTSEYEVVWKWNLVDHLIQEFDSTKENFGVVADNPYKFDFNFTDGNTSRTVDPFHFNGIDYNSDLDQIMVSGRNFSEVFIIDHSTTTEEAAASFGGNSNRGGDILFRFGNPESYGFGSQDDQLFFGQHDARWLVDSQGNYTGVMSIYNNGADRPGSYSTVDEVQLIFDPATSTYAFDETGFEVATHNLVINGAEYINFSSIRMSGAYWLDNGHYIVCHATNGLLQEIDLEGNIVWEYIYPVNSAGPVSQGQIANGNSVFKTHSYYYDHPAFFGRDLSIQGPIELDPIETDCSLISSVEGEVESELHNVPTLWQETLELNDVKNVDAIHILDIQGNTMVRELNENNESQIVLDVGYLPKGIYVLLLNNQSFRGVKL